MQATQRKNIIVCADGTGNTTIKDRGTNVFKVYEAVDQNGHRKDPSLRPQLAIYHDGVGTETLKYLRIFSDDQEASPVSMAMRSQSLSCGQTVIMAL